MKINIYKNKKTIDKMVTIFLIKIIEIILISGFIYCFYLLFK